MFKYRIAGVLIGFLLISFPTVVSSVAVESTFSDVDFSLKIGGYEEDDNSLSIQQTSTTLNNYINQTFKVLQMISKR